MSLAAVERGPEPRYRSGYTSGDSSSHESVFQIVGAEHIHLGLKFFTKNEKTFLSAVDASQKRSKLSLFELSIFGRLPKQTAKKPLSRFQQFPDNVITMILDLLDIPSLVNIASANIRLRRLVQSLSGIKKIQQNVFFTRAVNRLYACQTARHFSLKDFMETATSWICGNCQNQSEFAVNFCLMSCSRICQSCLTSHNRFRYMPVRLAAQCFGLEREEIIHRPGFALLPVPASVKLHASRHVEEYSGVEIISLDTAFRIAKFKYARMGGLKHLQTLVRRYLEYHNNHDPTQTMHFEKHEFKGLASAVEMCWWWVYGLHMETPTRLMVTTLPYLHPQQGPSKFEPGIWCEGCIGHMCEQGKNFEDLTLCVEETFIGHVRQCRHAIMHARSRLLGYLAEVLWGTQDDLPLGIHN